MFRKVLRSKLLISILLLIIVGVLIFVLLPMNYEKQAQTIDVVQFIDDVNLGTQITENMLTTRTIGLYGVDNSVITDKKAIVGKYAATDIRRTSNLYEDMFSDTWQEVDGAIDTMLKEGDKLVTVSLGNGAASVGGQIMPGSVVDVLTLKMPEESEVVYDDFGYPISGGSSGNENELELVPTLEDVVVYEVLNNALENIADLRRQWFSLVNAGDDEAENFDSSLTPAYVTLIVNDEQALLLANQEYNGIVHLVLSPDKDGRTESEQESQTEESEVSVEGAGETGLPQEGTETSEDADPNAAEGEAQPAVEEDQPNV